jgi:hypothetical protein
MFFSYFCSAKNWMELEGIGQLCQDFWSGDAMEELDAENMGLYDTGPWIIGPQGEQGAPKRNRKVS